MHAQTPSRFRQLSTPFFLIPAALDPPLDVVHDATTQLLDHVQPHAPTTMSNTHPSPAIKARLRPAPRSTPLFSTLPAPHTEALRCSALLLLAGERATTMATEWVAGMAEHAPVALVSPLCTILLTVPSSP
jgi:hypothetical protein